jgi:hypothetical protein
MDSIAWTCAMHGQPQGSSRDSEMKTSSKQPAETKDKVKTPSMKVWEGWTQTQSVTSYRDRQE